MQIFFAISLLDGIVQKYLKTKKQNRRELVAQGINILDFQSLENENN